MLSQGITGLEPQLGGKERELTPSQKEKLERWQEQAWAYFEQCISNTMGRLARYNYNTPYLVYIHPADLYEVQKSTPEYADASLPRSNGRQLFGILLRVEEIIPRGMLRLHIMNGDEEICLYQYIAEHYYPEWWINDGERRPMVDDWIERRNWRPGASTLQSLEELFDGG